MRVFKYSNTKYRPSMEEGQFKVTTFDFIRTQQKRGAIGDASEGVYKNLTGDIALPDASSPEHQRVLDDLLRTGLFNNEGNVSKLEGIYMSGSEFSTLQPDAHMFCVSMKRNDNYWQKLPLDEGGPYDFCMEISDFDEFSRRLYLSIAAKYGDSFMGFWEKCFFEENKGNIAKGTTVGLSYFRKSPGVGFEEQHEARAVFIPVTPRKLEPKVFSVDVADLVTFHTWKQ